MKLAIMLVCLKKQKQHKVVKFSLNQGNSEIPIEFTSGITIRYKCIK